MRYGSVCSGIEAATVAWHGLGWSSAFFSEIESFPKAVLAHRWPGVPDLGDFTEIGADRGPVDLLVGGTPCQSFSVAGLRGGMADARGNLALEFLRLAARLHARWVLWENVPGVLSSNGGRDFGALLGGLAELGYGFAYRVLDAQFFGVAQRRRRVFVVGHAGGLWQRAAAVLFERACLRGDPPPRRAKGARTPRRAQVRADGRFADVTVGLDGGERARALTAHAGRFDLDTETFVVGALGGTSPGGGWRVVGDEAAAGQLIPFDTTQITSAANRSAPGDPAHPLAAEAHPPAIAFHVTQDPISSSGATPALGCGNALGCGTLGVAVAIQDVGSKESGQNGVGVSEGGPAYTVDTTGRQGVATPILEPGRRSGRSTDDPSIGLGIGEPGDPMFTLPAERPHGVHTGMAVRRLTPRECERLQGFPDDYTAIPGAKDGPRYRALGNSMAVPVMRWLGRRIQMVEDALAKDDAA